MNTSNNEASLPELHQTILDDTTLSALFSDLETFTEVLSVIAKAGPGYVTPKNISLQEGHELITQDKVRGLQIRYQYAGDEWWDTLIKTPDGIRITRIKPDFQQ